MSFGDELGIVCRLKAINKFVLSFVNGEPCLTLFWLSLMEEEMSASAISMCKPMSYSGRQCRKMSPSGAGLHGFYPDMRTYIRLKEATKSAIVVYVADPSFYVLVDIVNLS